MTDTTTRREMMAGCTTVAVLAMSGCVSESTSDDADTINRSNAEEVVRAAFTQGTEFLDDVAHSIVKQLDSLHLDDLYPDGFDPSEVGETEIEQSISIEGPEELESQIGSVPGLERVFRELEADTAYAAIDIRVGTGAGEFSRRVFLAREDGIWEMLSAYSLDDAN